MNAITKSTHAIRVLSGRMADQKSTVSERDACQKVIHQELAIIEAQAALIAEALRLLGKQPANDQ